MGTVDAATARALTLRLHRGFLRHVSLPLAMSFKRNGAPAVRLLASLFSVIVTVGLVFFATLGGIASGGNSAAGCLAAEISSTAGLSSGVLSAADWSLMTTVETEFAMSSMCCRRTSKFMCVMTVWEIARAGKIATVKSR